MTSHAQDRPASRKTRKAQKEEQRRKQLRRELALLGLLMAALLVGTVAAVYITGRGTGSQAAAKPFTPIDGIPCQAAVDTYHEHAHLTVLVQGKQAEIPQGIGINDAHGCYYWLHTHDIDGIIHIEAPHKIIPTLGQFFDVWQQPLSRARLSKYRVASGQSMRVYVNGKPYAGNPRSITLHPHTDITIEIGPPFPAPARYRFASGY